ncbi:hypothetical protein HDE68_000239 [Pedobacter cryoconitis]|uniref:Uncharacterized protein n=1 Tax=Pedobacter cryoconitis TaxID=188932 RepID=A0A7W8ZHW3_9SPHI|nr:hypothetical protein [Pedobacter cryoconitis]MBB5634354.1 hypothetical protein [Pedobacter cryoconitis]
MINNFYGSYIDGQRRLSNSHRPFKTDIRRDLAVTLYNDDKEAQCPCPNKKIPVSSSPNFETMRLKILPKSDASLAFVLILSLTFINSPQSVAQCAMCSINAEQGSKNGNTISLGINTGVLILLGTVYFLMIALGIIWYKKFRKRSIKEVNNHFSANSGII